MEKSSLVVYEYDCMKSNFDKSRSDSTNFKHENFNLKKIYMLKLE